MAFYVSDSFTVESVAAPTLVHYPGPFNSSKVWGPNEQVYVSFTAGELGFIPYHDSLDGMNVDVQFGFYDVSSAPATPYGPPIPFAAPYGTALNGQVMHGVTRFGQYGHSRRFPHVPILFQGGTSPIVSATQIGAIFTFRHSAASPVTVSYQYFMEGDCL